MGIFSKSSGQSDSSELNAFLGVGTEYRGRLHFVGTVRIDGMFEGEISTEGTLVLGNEAYIKGTVDVGDLVSNGKINGDVTVRNRTILQKGASLNGSLSTPALIMEKGAFLEGNICMTGGSAPTIMVSEPTAPALEQQGETDIVAEEGLADQGDLG